MSRKINKNIFTLFKIVFSALLVFLIFRKVDFKIIFLAIKQASFILLSASLFIFLIRNYIAGYRLKLILKNKKAVTTVAVTNDYFVGMFFNFFLPTGVGGDIMRGYYLTNYGITAKESAAAIVYERILGLISTIFLPLFGLFFFEIDTEIIYAYLLFTGFCATIFYLIFSGKLNAIIHWIQKMYAPKWVAALSEIVLNIKNYGNNSQSKSNNIQLLLLSLFYQFTGVYSTYLIGAALGDNIGFWLYLFYVPLVWIISMLPISFGGIGIREGAFIFFFTGIGMPHSTAVAVSLIYLLLMIVQGLAGAVIYIFRKSKPALE